MKKPIRLITGTFGGKTKDWIDTVNEKGEITQTWKQERAHEQRHLKAYLRGAEYFRNGYKVEDGIKYPQWFEVKRINPEKPNTIGG